MKVTLVCFDFLLIYIGLPACVHIAMSNRTANKMPQILVKILKILNIEYWEFSASLSENGRTLNSDLTSLGLR